MKILQINAINKVASTGRTCFEMSNYLNAHGHTCVTAFSKGPSVDPEHEFKIGNNFDTKIHGLLSRISGKQGYFSFCATKKLLKYMDSYKPDVVLLRNLHGNYINVPMVLKYLAKHDIKTVVVLHDCWFYTGKCCHYTKDGCYKWKENCGSCPSLKKYNKSWFFDRTKSMLNHKKYLFSKIPRFAVVGVSNWLTKEAEQAPVFENSRVFKRIYNWINTEVFIPKETTELKQKLGLTDKKIILSVASSWSEEKGLFSVLNLAEKLNTDEVLLVVGNIPEGVSINERIICVPHTHSVDELAEYYSLADVFFQPSLEETFGKVSAEALSCGTPVVCFNSTANPELVGKNCGAVAEIGNIEDLVNKIRAVLSSNINPEVCREFAEENFVMKKAIEDYLDLFSSL